MLTNSALPSAATDNQYLAAALDTGNGYIKFATSNSEVLIPSLIKQVSDNNEYEYSASSKGALIEFVESDRSELNGTRWLVGQPAYKEFPDSHDRITDDRQNKLTYALQALCGCLAVAPHQKEWSLALASSIHDSQVYGAKLKEALNGSHSAKINGKLTTVNIRTLAMSFVRTDDEAIAEAGKHSDRPTKYVSLAAKRKVHKDFSSMALDYRNPNDWGKSPLTDRALRLDQFKAENPEEWAGMIEADIEALSTPIFESEDYPPFTGTEFLATHSTIDDHPYSAAFGQFLGNGIDPDIANTLAFGENRFDLISDDFDDPLRQLATRIYSRFEDMGYWDELPQESSDTNYDNIPY